MGHIDGSVTTKENKIHARMRLLMLHRRELIAFRKELLGWFRQFRRDLPWRRTKDPYRIWLSEIMLQQTRVAAVIPYYERFLKRFPDIHALAKAPQDEVLRLWSGLGYYTRARNLQHAAQEIVAKHGEHSLSPQKMYSTVTISAILVVRRDASY